MSETIKLDDDLHRRHGPEDCPRRCEACPDGKHHWMPEAADEFYYGPVVDPFEFAKQDMVHVCKHCSAWLEFLCSVSEASENN